MRKKEQRLWDRTKNAFDRNGIFSERIENIAGNGTPDVHGLARRPFWLELKAVEEVPVRPSTPLLGKSDGLRPEQVAWHYNYTRSGGTSLVLVGIGSHVNILLHGSLAMRLNYMTLADMLTECCASTDRKTSMNPIIQFLLRDLQ